MKKLISIIIGLIIAHYSFGQIESKQSFNDSLIAKLDTIYQEDQKYRKQLMEILSKSERTESDNLEIITLSETIKRKDSINLSEVKKILDKQGWLSPDVIGKQGNKTLFLVIQHADIETQIKYIPMMSEAVKLGNANGQDLALLKDRIAVRQGERQIYGSQTYKNYSTGETYVYPLIEPEKVNERRKEVGLEPIEEYLKHMDMIWDIDKHKETTKIIESKKEK